MLRFAPSPTGDMHIGNLMFIGDKMVVSDYGVTDNNANYRIN